MGIALFNFNLLVAPLQNLTGWLARWMQLKTRSARREMRDASGDRLHADAARTQVSRCRPRPRLTGASARPLRVLRVVDAWQAPASAGRMVISGRMADVCAELERLAGTESLSH